MDWRRDVLQPTLVGGILTEQRVRAVAGGWRHTMASDAQGLLYAWGWNKVRPDAGFLAASLLGTTLASPQYAR